MAKPAAHTGNIKSARTITMPISKENYKPFWRPLRPGADTALSIPSRMGDRLIYRDGRVETIK